MGEIKVCNFLRFFGLMFLLTMPNCNGGKADSNGIFSAAMSLLSSPAKRFRFSLFALSLVEFLVVLAGEDEPPVILLTHPRTSVFFLESLKPVLLKCLLNSDGDEFSGLSRGILKLSAVDVFTSLVFDFDRADLPLVTFFLGRLKSMGNSILYCLQFTSIVTFRVTFLPTFLTVGPDNVAVVGVVLSLILL